MWYVNKIGESYTTSSGASFILTMWYVNRIMVQIRSFYLWTFYINYVVCKFELLENINYIKSCFILTMWYVNYPISVI